MSKTNNPADLKAGDLEHVLTSCRVSPNLIFTIQESKLIRPSDEDEDEDHRIVALGDTQVCPQHDSAGESSSCILDHNGVFCGESGQGASAPVCRAVLASEAVHVGCTVDVGDSIDLGGYDVVHHDTTRLEARGGKMFLRPIGRKTSMRLYAFEDLATGLVAAIEARVLNRLVSAVPCCPDMYDHDDPRRGFIEAHGYAPLPCLADWIDDGHPYLHSHHYLEPEAKNQPCAVLTTKDDGVLDVSQLASLASSNVPAEHHKRGSLFLFATAEDAKLAIWNAMQPQLRRVLLHCCLARGIQPFVKFSQISGLACLDTRSFAALLVEHPEEESWL